MDVMWPDGRLDKLRIAAEVREVIKALEKAGWRHVRTAGDHRVFRSSDGRTTIVSGRLGDDGRARIVPF